jgi:hypothetical protein
VMAKAERKKKSSPAARAERDAARRHRKQFAYARNEVIAVLTRIWESHLMPPAGLLKTLDERLIVCIHSPAGHLWWAIESDEVDPLFSHLKPPLEKSHWDKSTRAEQSGRLELLRSTVRLNPIPVIGATPKPSMWDDADRAIAGAICEAGAAVPIEVAVDEEQRRPGQFHKPRPRAAKR